MVQEKPRILLVDDKPKNLEALDTMLKGKGFVCIKASSGNEALKVAMKECLALILLDVQMPGMDGYETAEILRKSEETQQIPIIFVTASLQDQGHEFRGYESGAVDYMLKPLNPYILKSKIRVFLELYEKSRRLEQSFLESRSSQLRLAKILDLSENAVISVDVHRKINFFNQRAEQVLGYSASEILGQSLNLLMSPEDLPAHLETAYTSETHGETHERSSMQIVVRGKDHQEQLMQTTIVDITLGDEKHRALIFSEINFQKDSAFPAEIPTGLMPSVLQFGTPNSVRHKPALHQGLQQEQKRIQALGEAFEGAIQYINGNGQALIDELRSVNQVLNGVEGYLKDEHHTDEHLEVLVQTMSRSINYWETTTQKTKIDLAEESGIWKVHLDGSTYRAKTLNRYLSLEKLPKKPRWNDVFSTAQYVLTHCPDPVSTEEQSLYSELKFAHLKLKKLYQENI